ncbi:MAG: metallopeptidase TldD-related protein [Thermoanaerobaculia bacterium]
MKVHEALFAVREHLAGSGWEEIEVLYKRGRSRSLHVTAEAAVASFRQEEGWAVRAGERRRSFYFAASGLPRADTDWPAANGAGLRLPSARPVPSWSPPSSLDAPLLSENEARGFFEAVARELDAEVPGARLLSGHLEDGSSESQLLSSRDVASAVRHRAASLRITAAGDRVAGPPAAGDPAARRSVTLELCDRQARRFTPTAVARRLADHLLIARKGVAPTRDRGQFLLAPPVVVGLLAALSELWIGAGAKERIAPHLDQRGRLGTRALTLIDDGRLAGGTFEAPVDGEGQPTREVILVDQGAYRQPLLSWWQTAADPSRASGCVLRPGWRDLPRQGPTHLYLRPDGSTGVAALVSGLSRGYYLLALQGEVRRQADRFAAPVAGFAIDGGRPTGPIAGAWLTGTVSALLNGFLAVARDLTFSPVGGGLVGSPTALVRGVELRSRG